TRTGAATGRDHRGRGGADQALAHRRRCANARCDARAAEQRQCKGSAKAVQRQWMTATIIDGKSIAADLRAAVKMETAHLRAAHGIVPGLAVVLLGDDPASQSYVASKSRAVAEVGMRPFDHHLPAGVTEAELL